MAKKKIAPEPVTAEEPEPPEAELPFEISAAEEVQPSPRAEERARAANPYGVRSARERRAMRGSGSSSRARSASHPTTSSRREKQSEGYSHEVIAELLHNPTITVTEDDLRRDYSYVIADLRSMGILAAALIVTLVLLAQFLPK